MQYKLSLHAQKVEEERKIPLEWIENALNYPDFIEADIKDVNIEHRFYKIVKYDNRILRVICKKNTEPKEIITAFLDRRMKGKNI
ncbi:MAG: DUF4258 domain-containing protein [Ignavibacteriales bacterium]|nr:DUF4258 domain-containing protein [Ignavibacteriales bacterium]